MLEYNGCFLRKQNSNEVILSDSCLQIDGEAIIRNVKNRFVTQEDVFPELFGSSTDRASVLREQLAKIAALLNEGRTFEALFIANLSKWRFQERNAAEARKNNFNPAEPREHGHWANEGGATDPSASVEDVQYRGHFHDVVVDDLIKGLASNGSVLIKNVPVMGLNAIMAIPDGASLPKGSVLPYFIEVKTGNDPGFTKNQQQVYPQICVGGHATSFDPRIRQLGLIPGVPFPPLRILVVHTFGPGLPLTYIDYCEVIGLGLKP